MGEVKKPPLRDRRGCGIPDGSRSCVVPPSFVDGEIQNMEELEQTISSSMPVSWECSIRWKLAMKRFCLFRI